MSSSDRNDRLAVTVVGFVAFDHAMTVAALPSPGSGALVVKRPAAPWPRLGGAGANVARAAAAVLGQATLISQVGTDDAGDRARFELALSSVCLDGLAVDPGRTAASWLFYDPEGRSVTFLDPGGCDGQQLTEPQRRAMKHTRWICVTAGSPELAAGVLNAAEDQVRIAWIVKADPTCFPPPLVERLAGRADVVVLNAAEVAFVGSVERLRRSVVITNGAGSIRYRHNGLWAQQRVMTAEVDDVTGAGDAFAGALVANLSAAPHEDLAAAITAATAWTRSFLMRRSAGTF